MSVSLLSALLNFSHPELWRAAMIKRVPLLDATTGQQFMLNGETTDIVPSDRTVYIDRQGNTYDPAQRTVSFDELPQEGVMELPRTTWWRN